MRLSQYVKEYLEETGMSQRKLAENSGVSPQTITNILKDRGGVDTATYSKIANGMNRPIYRLAIVGGIAYVDIPSKNEEDELAEYLEELRTRPEARMLLQTTKGMSMEQVKAIVAMIENIRGQ